MLKLLEQLLRIVLPKLLSGRFILTIIVGMIICVVCLKDPQMVKEFKEVLAMVIIFYFSRSDRAEKPAVPSQPGLYEQTR